MGAVRDLSEHKLSLRVFGSNQLLKQDVEQQADDNKIDEFDTLSASPVA